MTPPTMTALHKAFEARASSHPNDVAVADWTGSYTYAELDGRANAVAGHLLERGVTEGRPVGVHLPHAMPLAVALLGVLKAGGACLPLDPVLPPSRLHWMVEDSDAALVLTDTPDLDVGARLVCLDDALGEYDGSSSTVDLAVDADSAAYVIYTSGSTGRPKGVLVPHRGLTNHQHAAVELYGLDRTDAVLQLSSIGFDISIEEMFPTWAAGGKVVFRPADAPLSGAGFAADLVRLGISVLDLPTAFWHEWVRDLVTLDHRVPGCLRAVIVGGEKASAGALRQWRELGGDRVRWFNTYGPTEASVIATAWEAPPAGAPIPGDLPIGKPITGVSVHVLDPSGAPVPPGEPGELYIGGPGVALGYLNRPDMTGDRFVDDSALGGPGGRLYRTGDRVVWDGDLLRFKGRLDDQVKVRGYRVEPGEVEAALAARPEIDQAVVVPRPAVDGSNRLIAYVVPGTGATVDPQEILRLLPERLPLHMVPSAVVPMESLPLTANGKVDRAALPEVATATRAISSEPVPARDGLDRALIDLWKEVLQLDAVGISDDFFELGGHSLGAVRLLGMIEWLMGVEVPMGVLLEESTVAHVADVIRSGSLAGPASVIQPIRPRGSEPPLIYVCTVETGVVALRHIIPHLNPERPVYAYVLRRVPERDNIKSIGDFADVGVRHLLDQFPADEYALLGYSLGGLVAYQMATNLRGAGKRVEMLGMLDTWHPSESPAVIQLRHHLHRFGDTWRRSPRQAVRYAGSAAKATTKRLRHDRHAGPAATPGVPQLAAGELLLDDGSLSAIYDSYQPPPYTGRVLLITTASTVNARSDAMIGWSGLATAQWSVTGVPGWHGTVMKPENAHAVGQAVAGALDRTGRPSSAARASEPRQP